MNSNHAVSAPRWASRWLYAAGLYNVLWGAFVIVFPHALFDLAGTERMRYPEIWQCVGMIVGVYGIGYLIAARAPRVHWPIVLVGLLGKILGPIGFVAAMARGIFPPEFGLTILTNDLLWWVPFGMILWDAARSRGQMQSGPTPSLASALDQSEDQHGRTLGLISSDRPTVLVFTRHSGCTFCRELLHDLARHEKEITDRGYGIAVVTMSDRAQNRRLAEDFGLTDASWIADPERVLYRAFELRRGSLLQLFGPVVVLRGMVAAFRGHGIGPLDGDGFQMPGAFVLHRGRVIREFRHRRASDRPDLSSLACELPS
ncbi:MAG: SelL-related redox protein [Phycisphaerales bacterium JB041]